jgi:hypothetical protein
VIPLPSSAGMFCESSSPLSLLINSRFRGPSRMAPYWRGRRRWFRCLFRTLQTEILEQF